jgi:hypothetical protein
MQTETKMFRINKNVYNYLKSRYLNVNAAIVALIQAQDKSFNAVDFINEIDKNQLDIFENVSVGVLEASEQAKPGASHKGKSS